jgi:hypothetical protein
MANIGQYGQNSVLLWFNLSLSPTPRWVALSTAAAPGSLGLGLSGEINSTGSGYSRQGKAAATDFWGAVAGTPATQFNLSAMTFGPFSSNANLSAIGILDSLANLGTGNLLWYGLLATARNITAGDSLIIAASALTSQIN